MSECSVEGCERPIRYKQAELCNMHYQRLRNHGSTDDPRGTVGDRFWRKAEVGADDECWEWTGGCDSHGYGSYRNRGAHRVAYEFLVGAIPEGKHLDHRCHNEDADCPGGKECPHRRCVNPFHLEPIEPTENQFRSGRSPFAVNAAKTHCPQGHEYTLENTHHYAGRRVCIACKRADAKARFCKAVGGELAHTVPSLEQT